MPRAGSIKLQIASAYVVTASRMGSWLVVSALLYRFYGAAAFATLALVRGIVGILNYATVGIGPAVIHLAAQPVKSLRAEPVSEPAILPGNKIRLNYSAGNFKVPPSAGNPAEEAFAAGSVISIFALVIGVMLIESTAPSISESLNLDAHATGAILEAFALGTLLRLCSDSSGASLQAAGYITLDNVLLACTEVVWVGLVLLKFWPLDRRDYAIGGIGWDYFYSGILLFAARWTAGIALSLSSKGVFAFVMRWQMVRDLLSFGSIVMIAQLADYLYAPTDYLLINNLIDVKTVAVYAPAVQIDAALLLLVTGLAAVILPRSALAHAQGNVATVRQYYIRGTLASLALLIAGALFAWLIAPLAFKAWLGNSLPATRLILPLVLIHTVIGGSSAVGRSILLGIGKARPFAAAALIAGAVNVILSYCFVVYLHLGLRGIILGTIVAVVGRCGIWMPWYVMKQLRQPAQLQWEQLEMVE